MQKKYGFSTCLGGGERLYVQMGQLVALQLHPAQVAQLAEDRAVEGGQPVVVQVDVTQARQKRPLLNQLHTVEGGSSCQSCQSDCCECPATPATWE